MSIYAASWVTFDNSINFCGKKVCCSTGDILIIQKKTPSRIEKNYVHSWGVLCTLFFQVWKMPQDRFFQFYILCSGTSPYIKRMEFEVPKRLPPRVAKFQAIIALTNV